jgi:hypothetical protein
MKGIGVSRGVNGNVTFVNAIDSCGNAMIYTVEQYEARGYEPDWRTLPDENKINQ